MLKAESLIKQILLSTLATSMFAVPINSWAQLPKVDVQTVEILVDENYKPISYAEDGKAAGMNAEIFALIDKHLPHYTLKLTPVKWKEGLTRIRNGSAKAIMGTFNTGSLRPFMYPYSSPLYSERVIVICGESVQLPKPVQWPNSFKNKLMLNIVGFDGWLNNQVRHRRFTRLMNFLEVPNVKIAASMVERGNADCSLFESNILANMNQERGPNNPVKAKVVATVQDSDVHVGFSLKAWQQPENAYLFEFAKAFDFALIELKLNGEIDTVLKRYNRQL